MGHKDEISGSSGQDVGEFEGWVEGFAHSVDCGGEIGGRESKCYQLGLPLVSRQNKDFVSTGAVPCLGLGTVDGE